MNPKELGTKMRIGFLDKNLDNYHAKVFEEQLRTRHAVSGAVLHAAWDSDTGGAAWSAKHGLTPRATAEQVIEDCDALMVLAPDDLDEHPGLADAALRSGKPVFVDKQLTHDVGSARAMLDLAATFGTPVMSSSSLRFAVEVEELAARVSEPMAEMYGRGIGPWRGYACHTVTPLLRFLPWEPKEILSVCAGGRSVVALRDGAQAATLEMQHCANQYDVCTWEVGGRVGDRVEAAVVRDYPAFYANLVSEVVRFFETKQSPVSRAEMLMTVSIAQGAEASRRRAGEWVSLTFS